MPVRQNSHWRAGLLQMTLFDIRPYEGSLPFAFGVSIEFVHTRLGKPKTISCNWNKTGHTHWWLDSTVNFAFDNTGCLEHCGFGPGPYTLLLLGTTIWLPDLHPDPNPFLLSLDPQPVECFGFLVFLQLGVTTTGYHDDDPDQYAITAFVQGAYDEMSSNFSQPNLSRYR
jgi:hypothetical protein